VRAEIRRSHDGSRPIPGKRDVDDAGAADGAEPLELGRDEVLVRGELQ